MVDQSRTAESPDAIHLFVEASFADVPEWIPLLPTPGVYPHPTYGPVDLSADTVGEYVRNFGAGVYGQRIPVDLEHDLPLSGAMGYITEVRTNADGSADARVDWNERGKQVLGEDRFRYVSPTLRREWSDPVSMQTHHNVIVGAALTTRPYFKEQSLRPLITASEPVESRQGGQSMSDTTQTQNPTPEQEAKAIVDQSFGEKLALAEKANADLLVKFNESETARKAAEDRIAALEADAEVREYRERGLNPAQIEIVRALPDDKREAYLTEVKAFAELRKSSLNFTETGTDALGEPTAKAKLTARANELRKDKPELTQAQAFSEACRTETELYRQYRAETQA